MKSLVESSIAEEFDLTLFITHDGTDSSPITMVSYFADIYLEAQAERTRYYHWVERRNRTRRVLQANLIPPRYWRGHHVPRHNPDGHRLAKLIAGAAITCVGDLTFLANNSYRVKRTLSEHTTRLLANLCIAQSDRMKHNDIAFFFPDNYIQCSHEFFIKPASDPLKIAYIKDVESLTRSNPSTPEQFRHEPKYTVTTVARFAEHVLDLAPNIARDINEKWVNAYTRSELLWATKEDDCIRVINKGPSDSCMHDLNFKGHIHPAACYAGSPDIAIAYLQNGDGAVTARCVCNTKKRLAARPYGNISKITAALEAAGYLLETGALVGCHLRYIDNKIGDGIILPYVDAGTGSGGGALRATSTHKDGENWLRLTEDSGSEFNTYHGYEYNGVSLDDDRVTCDCCGCRIDDGTGCYSEYHGTEYCESCADNEWVYTYVDRDDRDYVDENRCVVYDGTCYLNDEDVLRYHDLFSCGSCNEIQHIDDYVTLHDNTDCCTECTDVQHLDHPAYERYDNPYAEQSDTVETERGWALEEDCEEIDGVWYHADDKPEDDDVELIPFVTAEQCAELRA